MRTKCAKCTAKHLAQAIVLMEEALSGYPNHRWLAIGHLAEAAAECPNVAYAAHIRDLRHQIMEGELPDLQETLEHWIPQIANWENNNDLDGSPTNASNTD